MSKVSIIIPSCNEKPENLIRTLESIYSNRTGEIEVIVGFNGEHEPAPFYTPGLTYVEFPQNIGIKGNINTLALLATGKYLLKLDAHTRISEGFDEILQQDMQSDWIVTPRFKIIKDDWSIQMRDGQEEFYDYFYLCCPFTDKRGIRFKAGGHWKERTQERLPWQPVKPYGNFSDKLTINPEIDETPSMHGSGWFMEKNRFFELGGFPLQDPYGHGQEPLWLGLKNWLRGGKLMVNKKVWYAHLHQDSKDRGYPEDKQATENTYRLTADYWLRDKDPEAMLTFEWFVNRFMPMPGWPEGWEYKLAEYRTHF